MHLSEISIYQFNPLGTSVSEGQRLTHWAHVLNISVVRAGVNLTAAYYDISRCLGFKKEQQVFPLSGCRHLYVGISIIRITLLQILFR